MNKNIIIMIVVVLVVSAGAFYGGMKYQDSKRTNTNRQFTNGQGRPGGSGNRGGFRPVNGEIISSDDKSITVKLADGSSKMVLLSEKTEINKANTATIAELKTGEKVAVFGAENSDGSITAQNIQLNPLFRGMREPAASPK